MAAEVELPWVVRGAPALGSKSEWGPRGWAWLHALSISYPAAPTKHERFAAFARVHAFIRSLPCDECTQHATAYVRRFPPDFSGSCGLQTWAWRFHNAVNLRLGKPIVDAEAYRRLYAEELSAANWPLVAQ